MKKNIPYGKIAGLAFLVNGLLGAYNLLMIMGGGLYIDYLLNLRGGLPNAALVCTNLLLGLLLLVGRKSTALRMALVLRLAASMLGLVSLINLPVEIIILSGLRTILNVVVWIMVVNVANKAIKGKAESVKVLGIVAIVLHFFVTGMSGVGVGVLNMLGTFAGLMSVGMLVIWLIQDALQPKAAAVPEAVTEEEPEIDDSFYRDLLEHGSITQAEYDAWLAEQKAQLKNK